MLETLVKELFDPRLGETFRIALGSGGDLELELIEVEGIPHGGADAPRRAPFSLVFRGGPRDRYLPQRIYELRHPGLGALAIFLVPIGPDEQGMRYQAVFN